MTCSITFVLAGVSLLVYVCVYFVCFSFFSFLFFTFFTCVYVFVCLEHDFYNNNNNNDNDTVYVTDLARRLVVHLLLLLAGNCCLKVTFHCGFISDSTSKTSCSSSTVVCYK